MTFDVMHSKGHLLLVTRELLHNFFESSIRHEEIELDSSSPSFYVATVVST